MILFVPAHDAQTYSNLAIAKAITAEGDICLFKNAAIKADLLQILAYDFANNTERQPLLAMSHGENGSFDDNEIYTCLYQIWSRLCIFIGGQTTDIRHTEAERGYIF